MTDEREFPSTFHQHYLDDPDCSVAGEAGGTAWFVSLLCFCVVVLIGCYYLEQWTAPPIVMIPPPPPPQLVTEQTKVIELPGVPQGWTATCIYANSVQKLIRPYWENPNCRGPKP